MSECFCTSDLIADTLTELEDARRESVLHDSGLPIPNRKKIIQVIKDLSFYDTGITPEYGDKIICLSTCEYTLNNGRFVVVAVRLD